MKRPRLTIGWLMVIVAVVALFLGLNGRMGDRRAALRLKGEMHRGELMARMANSGRISPGAKADYHRAMAEKYERAAQYPWLPVAPDPPEPE